VKMNSEKAKLNPFDLSNIPEINQPFYDEWWFCLVENDEYSKLEHTLNIRERKRRLKR